MASSAPSRQPNQTSQDKTTSGALPVRQTPTAGPGKPPASGGSFSEVWGGFTSTGLRSPPTLVSSDSLLPEPLNVHTHSFGF